MQMARAARAVNRRRRRVRLKIGDVDHVNSHVLQLSLHVDGLSHRRRTAVRQLAICLCEMAARL